MNELHEDYRTQVLNKNRHQKAHSSKPLPPPSPWQDQEQGQVPPEALVRVVLLCFNTFLKIVFRVWSCFQRILTELHLRELAEEVALYLGTHPIAAIVVAFITVACGIPILIFIAFAVITIFLTFTGFLLIEGTVLAAGSLALVTCLIAMTFGFTVMGIVGAVIYCTFMQVAGMVGMAASNEDAAPHFDVHFPGVLASLRHMPTSTTRRHRHRNQSTVTHSLPELGTNGHVDQLVD